MGDVSTEKILISGATLASLLHRSSASSGDVHGYLCGHVILKDSIPLSDEDTSTTGPPSVIATITSFISVPSHLPLPPPSTTLFSSSTLIGWFSARRKTPLRPSLKEAITTLSLSSNPSLAATPLNSKALHQPSLFLLLTTPLEDKLIHTHEYKAYEYRILGKTFVPKSLSIINIGPSFRSRYDSFGPNAPFPLVNCDLRDFDPMLEDKEGETLEAVRRSLLKDQKKLNMCAEGFEISRMSKLVGSEAADYTGELEDLYHKMLSKIEGLSKLVDQTSGKVVLQENHNMKLRYKVADLR